ncbi:MAG: hypothetical protein IPM29_26440 [Planctomycetes bacterium]|nr:hypothetical protein [Planctomycetota bacterium]
MVPHHAERIPASALGRAWVETMADVLLRQQSMPQSDSPQRVWNGEDGEWFVPPPSARTPAGSGSIAIVNRWGDPRIGVGFPAPTDVLGVWLAGQGAAPARAVRILGYRAGTEVAKSEWLELAAGPVAATLDFTGVDRIVVEARPALLAQGWYALDDLVLRPTGAPATTPPAVLDFEDLLPRTVLTGSGYRGLVWETGEGLRGIDPADTWIVHAPESPATAPGAPSTGPEPDFANLGTPPFRALDFDCVRQGDNGATLVPPDTCGAMGTDHFVSIVNANMSAWDRATGARQSDVRLDAFWGVSVLVGDPRIVWDPHAGRFVAMATDFSRNRTIYLAISLTGDPNGAWFKWSYRVDQGSDAGRWPDYPTLGVDARGIYTAAYMVGSGARMTIWAIDKAPLLAPTPAVGTITAWRSLPWEGAIQPCTTYGDPGVEYLVSRSSSTSLRLRRVQPPLTAPQLFEAGLVPVPSHGSPPDAPALGSSTPLSTIDYRPMNAVYRNGSVWTAHGVSVSSRAAVRWYEIATPTATTRQVGTISDAIYHYFYGSIAVDARGDVALGFSGSHGGVYAGAFVTGRLASDPPGETAPPLLVKAGEGPWQRLDGSGRNRWGDYSHTTVDPVDDLGFWTIQEWAGTGNQWRTWVTRLGYPFVELGTGWPGTLGVPALVGRTLPVIGGSVTLDVVNSSTAATNAVLAIGIQQQSLPLLGGTLLVVPLIAEGVALPQSGANPLTLPVPLAPALVSTPLLLQSIVVDPGASQGLAFSPALAIRSVTR